MFIESIVVGSNRVNCYLAGSSRQAGVIIDPGGGGQQILKRVEELGMEIPVILLTHGHFDHIGAVDYVRKETGANVYIHQQEREFLNNPDKNLSSFLKQSPTLAAGPDRLLEEGDVLEAGADRLEVIHTPGHSPGSICLYNQEQGILFSGDTIFNMGVGRIDFPGCSREALEQSIAEKLLVLPDGTEVYPGHGRQTTIGDFRTRIWSRVSSL